MTRLAHLAIAVRDLEAAARTFREVLGAAVTHREEIPAEGVRVAFIPVGEARVELLESLGPDTPVGRFLAARGEGVHHVAFFVEDLPAALERARAAEYRVVDDGVRYGAEGRRVAFLHPRETHGTLIELIQA